jgi:ribosomal protein S17
LKVESLIQVRKDCGAHQALYKLMTRKMLARDGDRVRIRETRPLSRTKRWVVADVLDRASQV